VPPSLVAVSVAVAAPPLLVVAIVYLPWSWVWSLVASL
jgi:hypothetical protein